MKKSSKLTTSLLLAASLVSTMSISAFAWDSVTYPDGGKWAYGYTDPGNSYYMGYSYYHHDYNAHTSSVSLDGTLYRSSITAPGYTSKVNAPSSQSLNLQWYYNPNA